jgi:uncharacterized protein YkwD
MGSFDHVYLPSFEQAWMQSRGHHQNFLNPANSRFGDGLVSSQGQVFAVQLFSLR